MPGLFFAAFCRLPGITLQFIKHSSAAITCLEVSGTARSIADRIAHGFHCPDDNVRALALGVVANDARPGKVHSLGTWRDADIQAHLASLLEPPLAAALRPQFEWYQCRGAYFHNDAHYEQTLFGIWCVMGAPAELVFPRADLRVGAGPGDIAVFDPFEVHGLLAPGCHTYCADVYEGTVPNIYVGFEIAFTPEVAALFNTRSSYAAGPVISSSTRIAAVDGRIEDF